MREKISDCLCLVAALAVSAGCGPTYVEPPTLVDESFVPVQDLEDVHVEPKAAATRPIGDFSRVFVAGGRSLFKSLDGGATFPERLRFGDAFLLHPECTPDPSALFCQGGNTCTLGDSDVEVSRNPIGDLQGVFVSFVTNVPIQGDSATLLYFRSPYLINFASGSSCQRVAPPSVPNFADVDKTTLAVREISGRTEAWLAWQDARAVPSTWLTVFEATSSSLSTLAPPRKLPQPGAVGTIVRSTPNCTFDGPLDGMGRGNLWSRPNGEVWYTFTNDPGRKTCDAAAARRTYVARIDTPTIEIACVDVSVQGRCATQGHLENHDPEMAIDEVSGTMALVYPAVVDGKRRVRIATHSMASGLGASWSYQLVDPVATTGDQTHPTVSLAEGVPNAWIGGRLAVTWYQPALEGPGLVRRNAKAFSFSSTGALFAITDSFTLTPSPFVTVPPGASEVNRGVFEYQASTFVPSRADVGSWLGVWGTPDTSDVNKPFRLAKAGWR